MALFRCLREDSHFLFATVMDASGGRQSDETGGGGRKAGHQVSGGAAGRCTTCRAPSRRTHSSSAALALQRALPQLRGGKLAEISRRKRRGFL